MKKVLLTAIMALAFCGSIFAQDSNWPDFNGNMYPDQKPVIAYVQVNGNYIDVTDDWANLEIAAFVGDVCRGHEFMFDETEYGDLYPSINMAVYYENNGEDVTFYLHNHATGEDYTNCTVFAMGNPGEALTLQTGEYHDELYYGDDEALVLSFSGDAAQTLTLEIDPYTDANGRDGYYLIAAPFGAVYASQVEGLMTEPYDFYSFNQDGDGEGNEWINLENLPTETELQPGMGYLYANSTGTDLVFTGTPLEGDVMVIPLLEYSDNEVAWRGWNLVGNPFAVSATLDRPFYTMNENGDGYIPNDADALLPAMYGAFVEATEAGQDLTFTKSAGAGKSAALNLNLSNSRGVIDRAIVNFSNGQQLSKLMFNENTSKVYIPMEGKDYAIVNPESNMGEMPVSFKAEKNGSYNLSFTSQEVSFAYLHLIDNMTGNDVDLLANPSYSFDALTTDYASRFKLVFVTSNNGSDNNFAFFSNGSFIINNDGEATLQVVDVTGRILKSETINGCANVNVDAASGVYMLRLVNGNDVKVQKVVVK